MSEALCACNRPIHDTAYRCTVCAGDLRRDLQDLRRVVGEGVVTIARLDQITRHGTPEPDEGDAGWHKGKGALYPNPLPPDLDRAQRYDAAVMELQTWARHIQGERGHRDLPIVRTWALACDHGRCARIHAGRETGTTCALTLHDHPLSDLAGYLTNALDWLRYRQEADEAFPSISAAAKQLVNVIDRHDRGRMIGLCACGSARYSTDRACRRCGIIDLEFSRADLDAETNEAVLTASEAAKWVADMGLATDTGKLRRLIWAWRDRGHLRAACGHDTCAPAWRGEIQGPACESDAEIPRYRFGDVLERVMASPALRAA